SVLFELGNTKVLCSISLQTGVPPFLKGKKTGWLTAEYAMLPSATTIRTPRESSTGQKNGRSIEISRLIGRSLRSVVNLQSIGEQTIMIDCDVLQADGGTRTACITGACLALSKAEMKWLASGIISKPLLIDKLAAISVGLTNQSALLDIDFAEDNACQADYNFVLTESGSIVEVQGTAEKSPITWQQMEQVYQLAQQGVSQLFALFDNQKFDLQKPTIHLQKFL
ncbi:MAG TPA: ribonuclease PH, partial [Candidatus Babeliales bacterium]|nr:ribonuclease PH [Candidatus Babeliales bacterium]